MNNTILKSTRAVLAGLILIVITSTAMDALLESTGVLPKGNLFVGPGLILMVSGTGPFLACLAVLSPQGLLPAIRRRTRSRSA
jgi:hypothetical protein